MLCIVLVENLGLVSHSAIYIHYMNSVKMMPLRRRNLLKLTDNLTKPRPQHLHLKDVYSMCNVCCITI